MKIDKIYSFLGLLFILIVISLISSCTHSADITNIPEICFDRDVLPIFQNNCAISRCHNGTGESGVALNNFTSIKRSVEPYKPYSSRLYKAIIATFGENRMPPGQPLSLANRTMIRLWIEQGAGMTTCQMDTTGQSIGYINPLACFSRDVLPVLVSHCATTNCHDAITHQEGYVFTSYSSTMHAVSPGSLSGSRLYTSIITASGENKMPPAGKTQLTTAQIDSIAAWIRYGALDQNCGEACDTLNPVTFSGAIWPILQTACTGCHSGPSPPGGVNLANYTSVATAAADGSLINSLKGAGVTRMPLGGSFSACRIREFEIWINNGYLSN
jgi:hypothetical protein